MFGTRLKDWDIFIMSSFNVFAWSWERCEFLLWLSFPTWKVEIRFFFFCFLYTTGYMELPKKFQVLKLTYGS